MIINTATRRDVIGKLTFVKQISEAKSYVTLGYVIDDVVDRLNAFNGLPTLTAEDVSPLIVDIQYLESYRLAVDISLDIKAKLDDSVDILSKLVEECLRCVIEDFKKKGVEV